MCIFNWHLFLLIAVSSWSLGGVRGEGVSSLSYKSPIRAYRISPTPGKNLSLLPGPTMNETRDPSSRFVQGWLKTDKGLLRAYPGFKG